MGFTLLFACADCLLILDNPIINYNLKYYKLGSKLFTIWKSIIILLQCLTNLNIKYKFFFNFYYHLHIWVEYTRVVCYGIFLTQNIENSGESFISNLKHFKEKSIVSLVSFCVMQVSFCVSLVSFSVSLCQVVSVICHLVSVGVNRCSGFYY